jgi:hypothetical protein
MFWKAFCVVAVSMTASAALAEKAQNPSEILRKGKVLSESNTKYIFRLLVTYDKAIYRCETGRSEFRCVLLEPDIPNRVGVSTFIKPGEGN